MRKWFVYELGKKFIKIVGGIVLFGTNDEVRKSENYTNSSFPETHSLHYQAEQYIIVIEWLHYNKKFVKRQTSKVSLLY